MLEKLNKYNSALLVFVCIITYAHLLFDGDLAWYTKESMYSSGLFLTAVVIYNLTRRRIYGVQKLGTLYLCFWFTRFVFHFVDRILLDVYKMDIEKVNLIIGMPIFFMFFVTAYLILNRLEKQWNRKNQKME
jgi:hypothetical protein